MRNVINSGRYRSANINYISLQIEIKETFVSQLNLSDWRFIYSEINYDP